MAPAASARARPDPRPLSAGLGLFAHDFDDPAANGIIVLDELDAAEGGPREAAPAITQDQLDQARAEAHALGLAAGRAEAETAQAVERHTLLAALLHQLRDADSRIRHAVDEAGAGMARLVLASLAAGFPSLCARHGAAELARFTREVTDLLAGEPRIVIRVHPAMLAALDECLATLEPERREAIVVEPRAALAPGDARIAWCHGLAVRDATALQARLADILAPLGLAPVPVPELAQAPGPAPRSAPRVTASPSQPTRFDVATAS